MNSLPDIKRRLESVKKTRQITGAMETISVAKMKKALERFEDNHAYFDLLHDVMEKIALCGSAEVAESIKPSTAEKKLMIVIASDKGLCGSFNHDIFACADAAIDGDTIVMPIGMTAHEHYGKLHGANVDARFINYGCEPKYGFARAISDAVFEMYGETVRSVSLAYSRMNTHSSWSPTVMSVLPFVSEADSNSASGTPSGLEFEPSPQAVFEKLLPLYVGGIVYGALVHSSASEHSARRAAMSAATKSADEMMAALSIEYNRARQRNVTEQITEIVGATQALGTEIRS